MLTRTRRAAAGAAAAVAVLALAPCAAVVAAPVPAAAPAEVVGGPDLASRGIVVHPGPGSTPLPAVDADTWLVADLTTGEVLAAKGAHTKVLPASTLKTLTSVTLMPRLDRNQVVTASELDAHAVGSHVGLVVGATYTVWDLWNGLLLPSANDAAAALAEADGGFAKTVSEMVQMAHHLQADDTTPKTPSGLDTPGQFSSAYDMALIARAALQIPDFRTITMTMNYDFPGKPVAPGAKRSTYKIFTENRLLRHHYRGTVGGKTGFTSLAHRTFWGAASRGGHTLVVTLFQIHEPTETAARKLLNWGFANTGKVTPVGTLVAPLPDPVAAGAGDTSATGGTSGGATSASGPTISAATALPWKKVGLGIVLLLGAGLGLLWWRRRETGASRAPLTQSHATHSAPPAPAVPARPAAHRSSSVVVSSPGRSPAGTPDPTVPGPVEVGAASPGLAPVEVGPAPVGVAAVDDPTADVSGVDVPDVVAEVPEPPAQAPKAPPPPPTGNVRLITPPGRPSGT